MNKIENKIELNLKIVTPMFMGGALPNSHAELREASIKGALRFWYRAIDPEYKKHEARIFGGSGTDEGQSLVLLRLKRQKLNYGCRSETPWNNDGKIPYLGYGICEYNKITKTFGTNRFYIKPGSRFSLTLLFKPPATKQQQENFKNDIKKIKKALWALIMFGGLGARSRRGFGSLAVVKQSGMKDKDMPNLIPHTENDLVSAISKFVGDITIKNDNLPEYTSFSKQTRIIVAQPTNGEQVFEWLAREVHAYRSYRSENRSELAERDHDIMYNFFVNGITPPRPPYRSAFGLPHNYFFSSIKKKGGVDFIENSKKGRRASPLFLKVGEFQNDRNNGYVIATFLPARLIPKGTHVKLTGYCNKQKCKYEKDMPLPDDFTAIHGLLDRFNGREVQL